MPLPIYTSAAFTNGSGVSVASNASVEVRRESDGSLVPIFEDRDGQNQITQPGFQADLEGRFEFYAEPAAEGWEITVTSGSDTHTLNSQFPQGGVFGIPEGERAINSQELLAVVSEAADVDEAVSFVGRGAIVESGTNANGSYVRWENGEQVCSAENQGVIESAGGVYRVTWVFPASFSSFPQYRKAEANPRTDVNSTIVNGSDIPAVNAYVQRQSNQVNGSDQMDVAYIQAGGARVFVSCFAWGFWK